MTGVIFIQQNFNFNNIVFLIDITQKLKNHLFCLPVFLMCFLCKKPTKRPVQIYGAPSGIRTCNLCLRRATHYPVVLWVHMVQL